MTRISLILFLCLTPFLLSAQSNEWAEENKNAQQLEKEAEFFVGRWDLTIDMDGEEKPAWLEIEKSGFKTLVGRFVSMAGSARPISQIHFRGGIFSFAIPPQWSTVPHDLTVSGIKDGDGIQGTIKLPTGEQYTWKGERAPLLIREGKLKWGKKVKLFDGKNMDEWEVKDGQKNQWVVEDGNLKSPQSGANLYTKKEFEDFKIETEVRYPKGSNSGIYLRGRYEVQVIDSSNAKAPANDMLGGIYGFIEPSKLADKPAGEWQKLEVTLLGRNVTVKLNGETIISDRTIPGITGGAIDSKEGEPGPIFLQGDHGPVEYRNIILTPAEWK